MDEMFNHDNFRYKNIYIFFLARFGLVFYEEAFVPFMQYFKFL